MIEIIPKPAAHLPLWVNILYYFSVGLLIASVCGYLLLEFYFIRNGNQRIETLKQAISGLQTEQEKNLRADIEKNQRIIKDFTIIADSHSVPGHFFDYLENVTLSRVWFTHLNLNPKELTADLSGRAESFKVLQQQIFILEQAKFIRAVDMSSVSMSAEGTVGFSLVLTLSPDIFKFK